MTKLAPIRTRGHHDRYDRFSVLLHWLMAALLIAELSLGLWMTGLPKDTSGTRAYWFNIHKSIGMTLGLLILVRLLWALARARVSAVPMVPLLRKMAQASHALLYVFMLLVPLSGFLGSVFSGYPIRYFGWKLPQLAARWEDAKSLMSLVHEFSVYALMLLIAVHVLAFVHHQFILKDGLIRRMC
ncbi:cytochrome b [Diaphorobacter caeni]|uniref:cytochrome b n=1 Tax=Diaphorobacter caeni TaxID=2784387 RepID=UPI001890121B|nr:cytochrome b [Diaphorobacter caeni]MBF5005160.1 cytochrome b [Diaphorobacter caeni]